MAAEPLIVHRAQKNEDTGWVVFVFAHGPARLAGQALSEDEYRALRVFFAGWRGVKLPGATTPDDGFMASWAEANRE